MLHYNILWDHHRILNILRWPKRRYAAHDQLATKVADSALKYTRLYRRLHNSACQLSRGLTTYRENSDAQRLQTDRRLNQVPYIQISRSDILYVRNTIFFWALIGEKIARVIFQAISSCSPSFSELHPLVLPSHLSLSLSHTSLSPLSHTHSQQNG
jgi:hypothetical protein